MNSFKMHISDLILSLYCLITYGQPAFTRLTTKEEFVYHFDLKKTNLTY